MARFDNYRLINLVKLLDLLATKNPRISDIRQIDLQCATTYYTDLVHAREWPPYIEWYGASDSISDVVADYLFDSLAEDEIDTLEQRGRKLSAEGGTSFTPTRIRELRAELKLDEVERGWFGSSRKITIVKELSKARLQNQSPWRWTEYGRSHLAYGLYAVRHENWTLAAYCMTEFLLAEVRTKFVLLKQRAELNGLRYSQIVDGLQISNSLRDLILLADPEANLENIHEFVAWSENAKSAVHDQIDQNKIIDALFDFSARTRERVWPSSEHIGAILNLFFANEQLPFVTFNGVPSY